MSGSEIELDAVLRRTRPGKESARSTASHTSATPHGVHVSEAVMQRLELGRRSTAGRRRLGLYPYLKRGMDLSAAVLLFVALSPVLAIIALTLGLKHRGRPVNAMARIGRDARLFNQYAFATNVRIVRALPSLVNIVRGDMAFIGPRPLAPQETSSYAAGDPDAERRYTVRPGLICDWWIRRHVNLDYVTEASVDVAYVESCSLSKDAGVIFRSLPGLVTLVLWGDDPPQYESVVHILGVRIDNISMASAIDRVVGMLNEPGTKHACFINPHAINEAQTITAYRESIRDADLVLADGFGTKLAGKILRRPICQNLCGTDLFPRLCAALAAQEKSVYLLGAAPGVADRVALWINKHYPGVVVKGCAHGHFSRDEEPDVVRNIAASGADLLIVGMGVPRQDIWIHDHIDTLGVPVAMSFGGLFDYFAGRVPRAPQWMREMGMEWVYRLIQEPRRLWRRYLIGNGVFLARVFREKYSPARHPGF